MSVDVRIPMILRTRTDGRELVSAEGASLQDVIADLDTNYSGTHSTSSTTRAFGAWCMCI